MESSKEKEISCEITGKVQDVGLRHFAKKCADELNVVGYIENNEDGTVSVTAQGESDILNIFVEKLKKGPVFSRVDSVEVTTHARSQDSFSEFEIR